MIKGLEDVKEIRIKTLNKEVLLRTELEGEAGKVFQAVGVVRPLAVRIIKDGELDTGR